MSRRAEQRVEHPRTLTWPEEATIFLCFSPVSGLTLGGACQSNGWLFGASRSVLVPCVGARLGGSDYRGEVRQQEQRFQESSQHELSQLAEKQQELDRKQQLVEQELSRLKAERDSMASVQHELEESYNRVQHMSQSLSQSHELQEQVNLLQQELDATRHRLRDVSDSHRSQQTEPTRSETAAVCVYYRCSSSSWRPSHQLLSCGKPPNATVGRTSGVHRGKRSTRPEASLTHRRHTLGCPDHQLLSVDDSDLIGGPRENPPRELASSCTMAGIIKQVNNSTLGTAKVSRGIICPVGTL
uniref:Uncharacterized protein n=1 Tax=Timema poppense TaxID=170557 RepID=A0A7R9DTH3_TIMPO|nr:unnamed protein product [Timema poppensis]